MMKPVRKMLAASIPALALAGVSITGAGAAAASPNPTPDGLTGAANMTNANAMHWGMPHAMTVNNGNGDDGMYCAVFITNGDTAPGTCH